MNGMPSENVDELDRRLTALEEVVAGLSKNANKIFAETRDVIHEHKKRVKAELEKTEIQLDTSASALESVTVRNKESNDENY